MNSTATLQIARKGMHYLGLLTLPSGAKVDVETMIGALEAISVEQQSPVIVTSYSDDQIKMSVFLMPNRFDEGALTKMFADCSNASGLHIDLQVESVSLSILRDVKLTHSIPDRLLITELVPVKRTDLGSRLLSVIQTPMAVIRSLMYGSKTSH